MKRTAEQLTALAVGVLRGAGVREADARLVAEALIQAELDGIPSHGLTRLGFYADQAASGKVRRHAEPRAVSRRGGTLTIDAGFGFAYPALALAQQELPALAAEHGIAAVAIKCSHHAGVLAHVVEPLARRDLLAVAFSNTPAAIAPSGGARALFGTNPIAFACPRRHGQPLVVDLSVSQVARGKILSARARGESIPDNWAVDARGQATTDASAALAGSMLPLGGPKGAALALMVEMLSAALTGANFGYEASSFFDAQGDSPGTGQLILAIDPTAFGGDFPARAEALLHEIEAQANTRVPGTRRFALRELHLSEGIDVDDALYQRLQQRIGEGS